MKNYKYLFLIFLSSANVVFAQLHVSSNSYVYVDNQYLTVSKNINLQNNGNLYLRNGSQLLQKTTLASTNSGDGSLSLFQEGTVNNFAYNYWCSPVGNGTTSNFGITMLNRPTSVLNSVPANIITTFDGNANPLNVSSRWIFKYLSSALYSQWIAVGAAVTIAPGEGFTMKGTAGTDNSFSEGGVNNNTGGAQRYDFRGKPNDGNIDVNVGAGKLTLTGNPYPSAIDLQRFLTVANNPSAINCNGIAYFWEQDKTTTSHLLSSYKGGYGAYAAGTNTYSVPQFYNYDGAGVQLGLAGTGTNYPRKFSPVGQGFMLRGAIDGVVTMSNDFRVFQKEGGLSHFDRNSNDVADSSGDFLPAIPSVSGFDYTTVSSAPTPQIRFNTLLNAVAIRQSVLTFHPEATDGVDHAMDAINPGSSDLDIYFVIEDKEYLIDAVDFDINKKIPLGFKNTTPSTFKITVAEIINFAGSDNVYLHDKVNDTYHDILNNDYEIELPAGVNNTRYEITFVNATLTIPTLSSDSFVVYQNNQSQMLTVSNPNAISVKSFDLFDISGKSLISKTNIGSENNYQFSTATISDAVYIVKLTTTDNQVFSKKISVFYTK